MYQIVQRKYYPNGNEIDYYYGSPPVIETGFETEAEALAQVRGIRASNEGYLYEKSTGGITRLKVERG